MRTLLLVLLTFVASINLDAQITQNEFEKLYNQLIDNLANENWSTADSLTTILLNRIDRIDSMKQEKQVLGYISIYSTAGLMNQNLITKEDALKKVIKY